MRLGYRLAPAAFKTAGLLLTLMLVASAASAGPSFTRQVVPMRGGDRPGTTLSADCALDAFNTCSGWTWVFTEYPGAIWGAVLDPNDCPGGCLNGGQVTGVVFFSRCPTAPGHIGGVGISRVDAVGCRTASLYQSGPMDIVHCVSGDRWTLAPVPNVYVYGERFAVTISWGSAGEAANPQLVSDCGIGNLYCWQGVVGTFPGCNGSTPTCSDWNNPPENSYIYVTDFDGDGQLEDICTIYGMPYPLAFPYVYPYGYVSNNLLIRVGFDCHSPQAVLESTWGGVKTLFE